MHWRDAAEQVEAGLATMLAWAAGDIVTASEMLRASDLFTASAARMASLTRIEGASIEELQDIMQACRAISAKAALFDVRIRALLAVMPGLATVRDATAIPSVATIRHVAAPQKGAVTREKVSTPLVAEIRNRGRNNRAVA